MIGCLPERKLERCNNDDSFHPDGDAERKRYPCRQNLFVSAMRIGVLGLIQADDHFQRRQSARPGHDYAVRSQEGPLALALNRPRSKPSRRTWRMIIPLFMDNTSRRISSTYPSPSVNEVSERDILLSNRCLDQLVILPFAFIGQPGRNGKADDEDQVRSWPWPC